MGFTAERVPIKGCGEVPEHLQSGRWAWGSCLVFYLLQIPVGADAARSEVKKGKALGWSPWLPNRGCGQRLSLFPLGKATLRKNLRDLCGRVI